MRMLHHLTYQQRIHQLSVIHLQPNQHPWPRKSQRLFPWKSQRLLPWKSQRLFPWKSQRLSLWKSQRLLLWKSQRLFLWKSQRLFLRKSQLLLLWKCQRLLLWKSQRLLLWKCQRLLLCPPVLRATPGMFMAPSTVTSCRPLAPLPALMALQRSTALLERVVLSTAALGSGEVSATTDSASSRVATKRTPLKSILSTRPVTGEARTEPTSGLLTMSPAPRVPGLAMSMSLLSTSSLKGLINGQYPSHRIATKRSDKEVDVWGTVTLKVEGGGTYTAYVHEYMQFTSPVSHSTATTGSWSTS